MPSSQRRQIPRWQKSGTPPDLRFLKPPLWDSPLESSDRGNRPWRPWNLSLEAVGFARPCGNRPRRPWDLTLEPPAPVGLTPGAAHLRRNRPWSRPPRVGIAPGPARAPAAGLASEPAISRRGGYSGQERHHLCPKWPPPRLTTAPPAASLPPATPPVPVASHTSPSPDADK